MNFNNNIIALQALVLWIRQETKYSISFCTHFHCNACLSLVLIRKEIMCVKLCVIIYFVVVIKTTF